MGLGPRGRGGRVSVISSRSPQGSAFPASSGVDSSPLVLTRRNSGVRSALGPIPPRRGGHGVSPASLLSYANATRAHTTPEREGHGAGTGVEEVGLIGLRRRGAAAPSAAPVSEAAPAPGVAARRKAFVRKFVLREKNKEEKLILYTFRKNRADGKIIIKKDSLDSMERSVDAMELTVTNAAGIAVPLTVAMLLEGVLQDGDSFVNLNADIKSAEAKQQLSHIEFLACLAMGLMQDVRLYHGQIPSPDLSEILKIVHNIRTLIINNPSLKVFLQDETGALIKAASKEVKPILAALALDAKVMGEFLGHYGFDVAHPDRELVAPAEIYVKPKPSTPPLVTDYKYPRNPSEIHLKDYIASRSAGVRPGLINWWLAQHFAEKHPREPFVHIKTVVRLEKKDIPVIPIPVKPKPFPETAAARKKEVEQLTLGVTLIERSLAETQIALRQLSGMRPDDPKRTGVIEELALTLAVLKRGIDTNTRILDDLQRLADPLAHELKDTVVAQLLRLSGSNDPSAPLGLIPAVRKMLLDEDNQRVLGRNAVSNTITEIAGRLLIAAEVAAIEVDAIFPETPVAPSPSPSPGGSSVLIVNPLPRGSPVATRRRDAQAVSRSPAHRPERKNIGPAGIPESRLIVAEYLQAIEAGEMPVPDYVRIAAAVRRDNLVARRVPAHPSGPVTPVSGSRRGAGSVASSDSPMAPYAISGPDPTQKVIAVAKWKYRQRAVGISLAFLPLLGLLALLDLGDKNHGNVVVYGNSTATNSTATFTPTPLFSLSPSPIAPAASASSTNTAAAASASSTNTAAAASASSTNTAPAASASSTNTAAAASASSTNTAPAASASSTNTAAAASATSTATGTGSPAVSETPTPSVSESPSPSSCPPNDNLGNFNRANLNVPGVTGSTGRDVTLQVAAGVTATVTQGTTTYCTITQANQGTPCPLPGGQTTTIAGAANGEGITIQVTDAVGSCVVETTASLYGGGRLLLVAHASQGLIAAPPASPMPVADYSGLATAGSLALGVAGILVAAQTTQAAVRGTISRLAFDMETQKFGPDLLSRILGCVNEMYEGNGVLALQNPFLRELLEEYYASYTFDLEVLVEAFGAKELAKYTDFFARAVSTLAARITGNPATFAVEINSLSPFERNILSQYPTRELAQTYFEYVKAQAYVVLHGIQEVTVIDLDILPKAFVREAMELACNSTTSRDQLDAYFNEQKQIFFPSMFTSMWRLAATLADGVTAIAKAVTPFGTTAADSPAPVIEATK